MFIAFYPSLFRFFSKVSKNVRIVFNLRFSPNISYFLIIERGPTKIDLPGESPIEGMDWVTMRTFDENKSWDPAPRVRLQARM